MSQSSSSASSQSETRSQETSHSEAADVTGSQRFLGCYLLVSRSKLPAAVGKTYVGFTVDPPRRIKQHNGITKSGGARRTSKHRPWDMVAVIHGFRTKTQALQFEWAWQHPFKCYALQLHFDRPDAMALPSGKRNSVLGRLKSLSALVSIPPWSFCPLTLTICAPRQHWDEFSIQSLTFPKPFRVTFSALDTLCASVASYDYRHPCDSVMPRQLPNKDSGCFLCKQPVEYPNLSSSRSSRKLTHCAHCGAISHLACMATCRIANEINSAERLLPVEVQCKLCKGLMHWSRVVRLSRALESDDD